MVDNNVRPESVPSRFVKRDGKTGGKVWKMLRDQIFMIFFFLWKNGRTFSRLDCGGKVGLTMAFLSDGHTNTHILTKGHTDGRRSLGGRPKYLKLFFYIAPQWS